MIKNRMFARFRLLSQAVQARGEGMSLEILAMDGKTVFKVRARLDRADTRPTKAGHFRELQPTIWSIPFRPSTSRNDRIEMVVRFTSLVISSIRRITR